MLFTHHFSHIDTHRHIVHACKENCGKIIAHDANFYVLSFTLNNNIIITATRIHSRRYNNDNNNFMFAMCALERTRTLKLCLAKGSATKSFRWVSLYSYYYTLKMKEHSKHKKEYGKKWYFWQHIRQQNNIYTFFFAFTWSINNVWVCMRLVQKYNFGDVGQEKMWQKSHTWYVDHCM